MRELLTTLELRQRLGEVLDRVALRHDEFVVARKGKPLAAIVSVEKLDQLRRAAASYLRDGLEASGRTRTTEREADSLADEAKHRTRSRRAGRP